MARRSNLRCSVRHSIPCAAFFREKGKLIEATREDKRPVFIASALLLITILLARMLIRWSPEIRVAWRLPGSAPKIATDSAVGLAQIALPINWNQRTSLPSNAALQAVDRFRGRYLTIISEPLDDFEAQVGLLEYTDLVMSNRLRKQDLTKVTGPSQRTVASHEALQYEYRARLRGMRITYLLTIVQGARAFHQVDCWWSVRCENRRAPTVRIPSRRSARMSNRAAVRGAPIR